MNKGEIAAIFLGEATVKVHVARLLHKLSCRERVHRVITAYRSGLV